MTAAQRWWIAAWLAFVVACIAVITRTTFTTDISAFLPRSPTPEQQVLVEQLREGVVSRLVLIGIEGAPPEALAQASKRLAVELRTPESFLSVDNGDDSETSPSRNAANSIFREVADNVHDLLNMSKNCECTKMLFMTGLLTI